VLGTQVVATVLILNYLFEIRLLIRALIQTDSAVASTHCVVSLSLSLAALRRNTHGLNEMAFVQKCTETIISPTRRSITHAARFSAARNESLRFLVREQLNK
jgi:hypothetical protein